ncbi:aromatic ring-opening dioxygenase LigB subunit [Aspergillus caelatus]|uniref:Aromatic ring-opening dioxygenase LigB subunit n=1 Tax=Aspergillus caelatus TaxID=61420 RepID=A0A5N6ZMY2_9EURO|nr:aromatic ring-opening dioxygenase LigB subunit [Aspergillus caelatus]KAE8358984.1 aromatic ring-opening dioxygenase LigB subunit [Aspergillus caelatus]
MSSQPTTTPTQQPTRKSSSTLTALSILTVLIAVSLAFFIGYNTNNNNNNNKTAEEQHPTSQTANLFGLKRFFTSTTPAVSREISKTAASRKTAGGSSEKMSRTPIYFLSHGGPNVMYQTDHPAYKKLGQIGKEITTKVKPKAVVVFSAHWQAGRDTIQVNTAEITDLIYDFYGFPSHYYKEKYPNVGSREVANKVLDLLGKAGIKAEGVKRGLDHGVWASFKCAFEPESNPLNVPIVQVSLFNNEDPVAHYRLGQAVSSLRDENILIIVSGMAVHNLRDLWFSRDDSRPLPYTTSFDEALKKAATAPPAEREQAMADLLKRPDARQAHPTFDHLLPIHIGAGAAGDDVGKRLWTMGEGSMSWAQFRFGQVANSSSSL